MLTVDEIFLLMTNDEGNAEGFGANRQYALAGAVLADLIQHGRLTLTEDTNPKLAVLGSSPTGDEILDAAVTRIREEHERLTLDRVIADGKLVSQRAVAERLARQGLVRIEERRMWGLVPEKYPVHDAGPETELRRRLVGVLNGTVAAEAQDLAILAILKGLGSAWAVLRHEGVARSQRELNARIEDVVAHHPVGDALDRAVQTLAIAVATATIVPTVMNTLT